MILDLSELAYPRYLGKNTGNLNETEWKVADIRKLLITLLNKNAYLAVTKMSVLEMHTDVFRVGMSECLSRTRSKHSKV